MDVRVHGHSIVVSETLRSTTERKVSRAARFFERAGDAVVDIHNHETNRGGEEQFSVEISTHAAGQDVRGSASGSSPEAALDKAIDRFERNLRKVHDRLVGRHRGGHRKGLNLSSHRAEDSVDSPEIVRVKQFVMKPLTPEDAALQMEQLGHNFFVFLNADSNKTSVLYQRKDGQLGLIEPA
jgi:putative sigma-54 modulation protein